jgi:hypothetical protein
MSKLGSRELLQLLKKKSELGTQRLLHFLEENPFLIVRTIVLIISFASLVTALGYVSTYTPEVYIRGVPFGAVLRSLATGGLLTVTERFLRIFEEIQEKYITYRKRRNALC